MKRHHKSFIEGFLELTKDDVTPDVFKFWSGVMAIAGAVTRKVWFTTNGTYFQYPNLYMAFIAPLNSRKSGSCNAMLRLLETLPDFSLGPSAVSAASLHTCFVETGKKNFFAWNGVTHQNSSVFLCSTEAAELFGGMSPQNQISSFITGVFNGAEGAFWSDKPARVKITKTSGTEAVLNPCLNMLICSTVDWLMTRVLTANDVQGGLGSRFVYVVLPEKPPVKDYVVTGKELFELEAKLCEDLKVIASLRGSLQFTPEALKKLKTYEREHDKIQSVRLHSDKLMWGCLGRKADPILTKLSMLLAIDSGDCVNIDEHRVSVDVVDRAWELLTGLEKVMPRAFKKFSISEDVKIHHDIMHYLLDHRIETVKTKQLYVIFKGQYVPNEIAAALRYLCLQGELSVNLTHTEPNNRAYDVRANSDLKMLESL